VAMGRKRGFELEYSPGSHMHAPAGKGEWNFSFRLPCWTPAAGQKAPKVLTQRLVGGPHALIGKNLVGGFRR